MIENLHFHKDKFNKVGRYYLARNRNFGARFNTTKKEKLKYELASYFLTSQELKKS